MPVRRRRRSPKKPIGKKKPAVIEEEGWHRIRRVLQERRVKGRLQYLVDWEDNILTGEKYPPSWSEEVTPVALEEWEAQKRYQAHQAQLPSRSSKSPTAFALGGVESPCQAPGSAEGRQPVQTRASVRARSQPFAGEPASRPASGRRHWRPSSEGCDTPFEEPGLDSASTSSISTASEAYDSCDQESLHATNARVLVEIPKANFNSDEYLSLPNSQASSQSLAELEALDSRIAIPPLSQRIIPDSQDPSDLSWICASPAEPHLVVVRTPSKSQSRSIQGASSGESLSADTAHQPDTSSTHSGHSSDEGSPHPSQEAPEPAFHVADWSASPDQPDSEDLFVGSDGVDSPGETLDEALTHQSEIGPSTPSSPLSEEVGHLVCVPYSSLPKDHGVGHSSQAKDPHSQPLASIQLPVTDSPFATQCIMETPSGGDTSRESQISAADELTRMLGLEPGPAPAIVSPNAQSNPQPPETTAEDLLSSIRSQADIPIHPPISLDTPSVGIGQSAWTQDVAPESSSMVVSSLAPSVIMGQTRPSAAQELLAIVESSFNTTPSRPDILPSVHTPVMEHATVSPADITRQDPIENDDVALPPMPSYLIQEPAIAKLYDLPVDSSQQDQPQSDSSDLSMPPQDLEPDYLVTLPFQASLRPMYDKVILEYKRAITDLSNAFSGETYQEPEEPVTKKIDELFGRLHNLCDYPWDVSGTTLEELAPKDIAKYCCDANSKFSFIFEFLQSLRRKTKILIVARSPELLRLIHHLTNALQLDCKGAAVDHFDSDREGSDIRVILALTSEKLNLSDFDVIIGYDSSFTTSHFLQRSSPEVDNTRQQLVLKLATTHSIEHIDLRISEQIGDAPEAEQKNVLVAALVRARPILNDPERGSLEPHEVADIFARYVNGDDDSITWEAQGVPEDVLDVFLSQPSRSQIPLTPPALENGRKRKNDAPDDLDPKRSRVKFTQELERDSHKHAHHPPLPDEVRDLLETAAAKQQITRHGVIVRVPLSILQVIAQQGSEYERLIKDTNLDAQYKATITNLEKRVKEYERTSQRIYESNRIALQERTQFEAEKHKAEAALQAANEAAEKEVGVFRTKIKHLQETIVRLTQDPDSTDPSDTPLAKSEGLLKEALGQVAALEKRLGNSHEDESYIKNAYQDASAAAAAMKSELDSLKTLNAELEKKASANAVRIHEIQANNTAINHVRQIKELETQVRDREAELDRAREELRQLKNGRRETRGVSAPHSPRMGILSPRVNKAYGSASRGTSPASVAGVEGSGTPFAGQQPGNPRWNHLRE